MQVHALFDWTLHNMRGDADATALDSALADRELFFDDLDLVTAGLWRGRSSSLPSGKSGHPGLVGRSARRNLPCSSMYSTREACSSGARTEISVPPRPMCSA